MSHDDPNRTSTGEWIVAAIGAALVVLACGTLVADALAPDTPPDVTARVVGVSRGAASFVVEVELDNAGGRTAADLGVEGTLRGAGATEVSEARLPFLPPGSTRTVGLVFTHDPRAGDLAVRPTGYTEP